MSNSGGIAIHIESYRKKRMDNKKINTSHKRSTFFIGWLDVSEQNRLDAMNRTNTQTLPSSHSIDRQYIGHFNLPSCYVPCILFVVCDPIDFG